MRAASIGPPQGVSQLVVEVTKTLLLHKLGIGAAVVAVVAVLVGIAAAVPRSNAAPEKPQTKVAEPKLAPAAAPAAAEEPAWKVEFRKAYGLKDGEVIRRVAPPYPACRAENFRDEIREDYKRRKLDAPEEELNRDYSDHFIKFRLEGRWTVPGLGRW